MSSKTIIGISIGDINGIGAEVILKTFMWKKMFNYCTPVVFGHFHVLQYYKKRFGFDVNLNRIPSLEKVSHKALNVINVWDEKIEIEPGTENTTGAKIAFKALQVAARALNDGKINALVTAPICKKSIQQEGFKFQGQTEFVQESCQKEQSLMLLSGDTMNIGVASNHVALSEVKQYMTKENIRQKLNLLENSLKLDFRKGKPLIAVLGLNPHAGEQGEMGSEEQEVITPVIEEAKEKGILAFGPYSPDAFFSDFGYQKFDGILAMYHDQGLIPFKMQHFDEGVNFTAGLPIIRTSPDHGTAFDIAGKGTANETSFRNAVFLAIRVLKNRIEYKTLTADPLGFKEEAVDASENQ